MISAVIIHGTENNSRGNWFPWLAEELTARGVSVISPDFPTPAEQNLNSWMKVFHTATTELAAEKTIIVGHSTGAVLALRLAEQTSHPFLGVCAVCPFAEDLGLTPYDELNSSFVHPDWDWARVQQGARQLVLLAGEDDPYVPLATAQKVASALHTELKTVANGGHLNAERGFTRFPLLLSLLAPMLDGGLSQEIIP